MPYKYFNIVPVINSGCIILNEFQSFLDAEFYNAPDAYIIQEETFVESNQFANVEVRITKAIDSKTGDKLGDDFKNLIFKDLSHASALGTKYIFDNNTWIVINTEIYKNFAAGATIRRCNNMLRWTDSSGIIYQEPCAIEYKISRPRDQLSTSNLVTPAGYIDIYCQENAKTKKIKGNQRFLFGPPENRVAFKLFGDGVRNYLNQETTDDSSATLLQLSLGGNFVNPDTDDLINGIADRYTDYNSTNSGSSVGAYDIIVNPVNNYVLESGSQVFNVNYSSGSNIHSGSFTFSLSGSNVPANHYLFDTINGNSFYVYNLEQYLDAPLNIKCAGASGSRVVGIQLRGVW